MGADFIDFMGAGAFWFYNYYTRGIVTRFSLLLKCTLYQICLPKRYQNEPKYNVYVMMATQDCTNLACGY